MIIVTGSIFGRPESIDELIAISVEHVRRSRGEPGCPAHAVHRDVEAPCALVFLEQWADRSALLAHFRVPESRTFVARASALAAAPPQMALFPASPPSGEPEPT